MNNHTDYYILISTKGNTRITASLRVYAFQSVQQYNLLLKKQKNYLYGNKQNVACVCNVTSITRAV